MSESLDLPPDSTSESPIFEDDPPAELRIWGFWMTFAFGIVVLVAFTIGQTAAVVGYLIVAGASNPGANIERLALNATSDGTALSMTIMLGSLPAALLTVLLAWARNTGRAAEYLGLRSVSVRAIATSFAAIICFVIVADTLTMLLDRDVVPQFMSDAYETVAFKPLLWIAACLAAPAFEEIFFRGFLIPGWAQARYVGPIGAVLLSSAVWTAIHLQYGPYELTQVFLTGLIFGAMRIKTGSTWPSFAGHVLANVVATTEAAFSVS